MTLETKTYPDGYSATGTAPLPDQSPAPTDTERLERLNAHMQGLDARVWGDIFGADAISTFHLREAIDRLI